MKGSFARIFEEWLINGQPLKVVASSMYRMYSVFAYLVRQRQAQLDLETELVMPHVEFQWLGFAGFWARTLSGTASAYVLRWATARKAAGRARTAARARRREFMVDWTVALDGSDASSNEAVWHESLPARAYGVG